MTAKTQEFKTLEFEVLVLGAGLVGLASALALAQQGLRVALLERQSLTAVPHDAVSEEWDSRIYAISPGNADWLAELGVWPLLSAGRLCAVDSMQIFGDQGAGLRMDAYQANLARLSWIVEGKRLQQALQTRLQALDVPIFEQCVLNQATWQAPFYSVQDAQGNMYQAELLVAADGAASWLRNQADITVQRHDYAQMGVVANFACEHDHAGRAFQWFFNDAEHGESVLAWLPLPQKHISMVWSASNPQAQDLLALDAEALAQQVAAAGKHSLGALQLITPAQGFPLSMQTPERLVQAGLALVGDAAHLVHPLAGQGVNLGLRDVKLLAETLGAAAKGSRQRLGDISLLRRYERARKADMMHMRVLTHGLATLYASPSSWLGLLRNEGLGWLDQRPALKKKLIQQAVI